MNPRLTRSARPHAQGVEVCLTNLENHAGMQAGDAMDQGMRELLLGELGCGAAASQPP